MTYAPEQIAKADNLVGTKQKIYYPWKQKFLYRVIRKDHEGYFVKYKNKKMRCRLRINEFGDMVHFEMLHG